MEEEVCLRCGRCVNVCPMHLTPVYMHLYAEKGMWKEAEALNVMDCIECGSCNYKMCIRDRVRRPCGRGGDSGDRPVRCFRN